MTGVAAATTTSSCDITNTGPGSVNNCTLDENNITHVTCVNDVYVIGSNEQKANSGNANNGGNTTGGSATTGDVRNDNNQSVSIGASCGAQVAATTPSTPATGGKGAGPAATPAAAAAAPASANVASLPHTGSNAVLDTTIASVAVVGGAMAVSQLGVSAYRRFALK